MRIYLLCIFFLPAYSYAQFAYTLEQNIHVEESAGQLLNFPWAGGLNSPQFNTMDLNADGKEDLVVYDRAGNRLFTFLQENGKYVYAPEYERQFPEGIRHWLLLSDFNGDGKKDIFTSDPFGLKVYV
ncbi:MAG TPA: VCBS repeat-containing protein, partial [Cyclobacteriaceae bacterium]|nr:VCBS repeat-containing protein [Cyclobacteriaceae bacterium]